MMSRRGGFGSVGYKNIHHFSYDTIGTLFYVVPLEVRKEILLLESKESSDHLYHSDSDIVGKNMTKILDPGRFKKRMIHFLNSLALD